MDGTPIRVITGEQLSAYHKAKEVFNASCLRCGNENWKLLSNPGTPLHGLPVAHDDSAVDTTLFTPMLVLACSNCGSMWQIASQPIVNWLDENWKES